MGKLLKATVVGFLTTASMFIGQNAINAQVSGLFPCDSLSYLQTEDGACLDLTYLTTEAVIGAVDPDLLSPLAMRFITVLQELGISITHEDCEAGLYGFYDYAINEMTICQNNLKGNPGEYIATLAHESWHVVQDYVVGLDNNETALVTLDTSGYVGYEVMESSLDLIGMRNIVRNYDGEDHPFEIEAFYMEEYPEQVLEVLEGLALP